MRRFRKWHLPNFRHSFRQNYPISDYQLPQVFPDIAFHLRALLVKPALPSTIAHFYLAMRLQF